MAAPPPKPGTAAPKLAAVDPTASRAIVNAKRAEATARGEAAKATTAETKALDDNTRAQRDNALANKKAADATKDLAKAHDHVAAASEDAEEAAEEHTSAFGVMGKAAEKFTGALEGVEAAYKLYIAANYDAIRAATMATRMMKQIPKNAGDASKQIGELTKHFITLRDKTTEVANKFIIPWKEADAQIDQILTSFGAHMKLSSAGAEGELTDLYGRMRSVAEFTGESFDEQLQNIDVGLTHLGMSAEAYQSQIEEMAKAPGILASGLEEPIKAAGRYKDILKANGVIRAVQDMVKSLDDENISVKKLAASYGAMIKQSIEYGRSQKESIAYAEKMTKALAGSGSKTEMFDVPQFLAGQKMMASLKAEGLDAGGAKGDAAREAKKQQFLTEMGVKPGEKATDDQNAQATKKVDHLLHVLQGGTINAGAIGAFGTTQDRIHSKVEAAKEFSGLSGVGSKTEELPKVQTFLQQILGVEQASKMDASQFWEASQKNGGDLEKTITDYQADLAKNHNGFGEGEKGAAAEIAHQRLAAESLNVLFDNAWGPQGDITKILASELKNLTSIEGATGAIAAVITMGAYQKGSEAASGVNKQVANDMQLGDKAGAARLNTGAGNAEDIKKAQDMLAAVKIKQEKLNDVSLLEQEAMAAKARGVNQDFSFENFGKALNAELDVAVGLNDPLSVQKDAAAKEAAAIQAILDKQGQGAAAPPPVPGHRTGISNVPYDDYLARLHEGESVMTKQQSRTLRDAMLRAPQPSASTSAQSNGGGQQSADAAISNGQMPMDAKIVGDKLVFTVSDAGSTIAQLLLQARNNNVS